MSAVIEPFPIRSAERDWRKSDLIERLRHSRESSRNIRHRGVVHELPSRESLQFVLHKLSCALFPTHFGQAVFVDGSIDLYVASCLQEALPALAIQVQRSLQFDLDERAAHHRSSRADAIINAFAAQLPKIRDTLVGDFRAAYRGDPAAESMAEVVLAHRGTIAIIYHRFAHALHDEGVRLVARLIADIALEHTGIDIHPAAMIGEGFFIDHGSGVVIGQTAVVGKNVRLSQGVTLGAGSFTTGTDGNLVKGEPRHPVVGNNVVIHAGATLLGRIIIGDGAVVNGNAWIAESVSGVAR